MKKTTMGLFGALAENGRMAVLVDVAEVYARILQAEILLNKKSFKNLLKTQIFDRQT